VYGTAGQDSPKLLLLRPTLLRQRAPGPLDLSACLIRTAITRYTSYLTEMCFCMLETYQEWRGGGRRVFFQLAGVFAASS
jgi:hypothetical protein